MALQGIPVVIAEKGGIPVVQVEGGAPLMTEADNGLGIPITLVEKFGIPAVVEPAIPLWAWLTGRKPWAIDGNYVISKGAANV